MLAEIERHREHLAASGEIERRRRSHLRLRVETILKERVVAAADRVLGVDREVERGHQREGRPLPGGRPAVRRRARGRPRGDRASPRTPARRDRPRSAWHDREDRPRRHRGSLDRRGARALRGDGAPRRGDRGGAARGGAGGDDPLRRVEHRAAGADERGFPDRQVPGEARPRHPPSLPGERRRAGRRRPAARGGLPGAPPRAHPRRGRLLGAVRPSEERRRGAAGIVREGDHGEP